MKRLLLLLTLFLFCFLSPVYAAGDPATVEQYRQDDPQNGEYFIGELSGPDNTLLLKNHFAPGSGRIYKLFNIGADGSVTDLAQQIPEQINVEKLLELRSDMLFFSCTVLTEQKIYSLNLSTLECAPADLKQLTLLPENIPFNYVFPPADAASQMQAVIVFPDQKKAAKLSDEDCKRLLSVQRTFPMDRVVLPRPPKDSSFYVNFYYGDQKYTVTGYGDVPYAYFGDQNYVYYMPYVGNARNAIYTVYADIYQKYAEQPTDPYEEPALLSQNALHLPADSWAVDEINLAAAGNLLPYELAFSYNEPITREEFCFLALKLLIEKEQPGLSSRSVYMSPLSGLYQRVLGIDAPETPMTFTDEEYPSTAVVHLVSLGILNGRDDGTFDPDGYITREEAAKILYKLFALYQSPSPAELPAYEDAGQISGWAKDFVAWASSGGIMNGMGDGSFAPQGTYNRQQAIATMNRLFAAL
jgi:hypothetical protein